MAGGNIVSILMAGALANVVAAATASETAAYSYDALGRLRKVAISGGLNNGVEVATCFDAAGNRTNHNTALSGGASCSQPLARAAPAKSGRTAGVRAAR